MLIEETIWMEMMMIKIAKVFMIGCYASDSWFGNDADQLVIETIYMMAVPLPDYSSHEVMIVVFCFLIPSHQS